MNASFLLLAVLGLVLWTSLMVVFALLVTKVLTRHADGGWRTLRSQFPTDREPTSGRAFHRETVQVGLVRGKRSTTVIVAPEGLYLRAPLLGTALVPWKALYDPTPTTLFWRDAVRLSAGSPASTIVVRHPLFEAIRPFLSQGDKGPPSAPRELVEAHV